MVIETTIRVQSSLVQGTKIVQLDFTLSHCTGTKLRSFCPSSIVCAREDYDNRVFWWPVWALFKRNCCLQARWQKQQFWVVGFVRSNARPWKRGFRARGGARALTRQRQYWKSLCWRWCLHHDMATLASLATPGTDCLSATGPLAIKRRICVVCEATIQTTNPLPARAKTAI